MSIFRLENATEERRRRFADTLARIDYPWWRLLPRLRDDPDGAVIVRWDDTPQGTTGLYLSGRVEIVLSEADGSYTVDQEPFVLAHELGHLVDSATLSRLDRYDLMALFHTSDATYRRDGQTLNGRVIEHAHVHDHTDLWQGLASDHYYLRHRESFADLFVAAFAPSLWDGRTPRFTHWTDDLEAFRQIVLREDIQVFDDVPTDSTHAEAILWAAERGLVGGYDDGTFRPYEPVTRAQLVTILKAYDATR